MRKYYFQYRFHPVGQGLFASGLFGEVSTSPSSVQWVYDCGTLSSQKLLAAALWGLRQPTPEAKMLRRSQESTRIELVTLSHFDRDHISGVCDLLAVHSVDRLLLPYLPLWRRLLVAFEEGIDPRSPLMRFFLNPGDYLTSAEGAQIGEIVFVLPGSEEGPLIAEGDPNDAPSGSSLDADYCEPENADEGKMLQSQGSSFRTSYLKAGGAVRFRGLWEFIPYNDDCPTAPPAEFLSQVANFRDKLLAGMTDVSRLRWLVRLKEHYEKRYRTGVRRNAISLFLYAGPVFVPQRLFSDGLSKALSLEKCSILYTGDGYLNKQAKLNRIVHYLRPQRVDRIGVFQVMHHGAERNWHPGVANRFAPRISIFSSDPKRRPFCHPRPAVWRDFEQHGPIQVDKQRGATVHGRLDWWDASKPPRIVPGPEPGIAL